MIHDIRFDHYEILRDQNFETFAEEMIKDINDLLKASLSSDKRVSEHGDVFTMYLWNICEKLWVQSGSICIDLFEKGIY